MDVPAGKRLDLRGKQLTEDLWIRGSDVYVFPAAQVLQANNRSLAAVA